MKTLYLSFLVLFSVNTSAQQISNLYLSPATPTVNDTIYVYADLTFSSSGCELDNKSHSIIGNDIGASTHHCWGMLTAICNITDTFKIEPLPAGVYNFYLTLTSGAAPAPCTPGIVPDDYDTLTFEVIDPSAISEIEKLSFKTFPNPSTGQITIQTNYEPNSSTEVFIYSADQKLVARKPITSTKTSIDLDLPSGVYTIQLQSETSTGKANKMIIIN